MTSREALLIDLWQRYCGRATPPESLRVPLPGKVRPFPRTEDIPTSYTIDKVEFRFEPLVTGDPMYRKWKVTCDGYVVGVIYD